jgi:outer membrane protein assembly factor BamB
VRSPDRQILLALSAALALAGAGCGEPCGAPGDICRVAGTGERAFNGDGHDATDTAFYLPSAVRQGPDGRVYVMDFNNMRLRVVEDDGTMGTFAGSGVHYYAATGGPATESPFENPIDFAFEPSGETLLVSLHDPRVLRIDAGGILRLVAGIGDEGDSGDGGPALSARFTELHGVAAAPDGTIVVADGSANRVRVITPDGTIEAFAGTGESGYAGDGGPATEALLRRPTALAIDAGGAVYIADADNHVVRRVDPDGIITTVAGTGERGSDGDGGPATAARLAVPEGVAVAADGTLYIAEWQGNRVRAVAPDGTITTLAGRGSPGLTGDGGPALEATLDGPARLSLAGDRLYVADQRNGCARVVYLE